VAAASMPGVAVTVSAITGTAAAVGGRGGRGTLGLVSIKYKAGLSPEVVQFLVWLYGDDSMAQPLEVWQVWQQQKTRPCHLSSSTFWNLSMPDGLNR